MDFTIIDAVVAVVIIVSGLLAYSRGLVREILAIAGWVAAAVVAYIFAPQAEPLMKEVPILSDVIAGSCEISMITAFAAVFAAALIVASIFTPLFASLVQRSAVGGVDMALGFFFGVLRGLLLVAIAFIVYERVVVGQSYAIVDQSQSAKIFAQLQTSLSENIPEEAPGWITARYEELLGACEESSGTRATGPRVLTPPATGDAAAPADGAAPATGN
ncbi:MAG: CvpA family protein [Paracoccaceae bacterium]|nr:CvpA family protein [Paracoccaceae bacterium]